MFPIINKLISLIIKIFLVTYALNISTLKAQNLKIEKYVYSKILLNKIFQLNKKSFYCNCSFKNKVPNFNSCGYIPFKNYKRASRIEWEHIVPASKFGRNFKVWIHGHEKCKKKNGKPFKGRKCAKKMNREYRFIESDLYNLQPVIGEINLFRNNYSMSMIKGEMSNFGNCDFEVKNKLVEPPRYVRGNIARTYFYMNKNYSKFIKLDKQEIIIFQKWDLQDPVDKWECELSKKIKQVQGNANSILENRCK